MRLVLATRSPDKAREIREILGGIARLELLTLDEFGLARDPEEAGVERGQSFLDNATAKALHFLRRTRSPVLADDSGLEVAALAGAPGVYSKRFSGRDDLDGQELDQANNRILLERLHDVPTAQRGAHYVCVAVLALAEDRCFAALGTCAGQILRRPRGTGGFGYDPLFFLPEAGRSFAELAPEEKNRRSHRARAFRALAPHLHHLLA
ncbi:MAG: non-canonical purine NTP pyrophosphatase [Gemmatimonadetes bacterium]|nr:non-canonical purine NTP pyrophosphatase [Gemmatimonadota bacterium]